MATQRYRKELLLTSSELTELRLLATRFKIDATSMLRVLIQLGKEALPKAPYPVDVMEQGGTSETIKTGTKCTPPGDAMQSQSTLHRI
jgi:hypothetical protein